MQIVRFRIEMGNIFTKPDFKSSPYLHIFEGLCAAAPKAKLTDVGWTDGQTDRRFGISSGREGERESGLHDHVRFRSEREREPEHKPCGVPLKCTLSAR